MRLSGRGIAATLACGAVCLVAARWWTLSSEPAPAASAREVSPTLACAFARGDRLAYDVTSRVGLGGAEDRFDGALSIEVVESSDTGALWRAAFTGVSLSQSLTQPRERTEAAELEGAPFFVRVDDRCRFTEVGFDETWSPMARELVTTVLRAHEIVLPGDARASWQVEQRDGGGDYVALYTARVSKGGVRIVRLKHAYEQDPDAQRFGVDLAVLDARAEALFDAEARAMHSVRGHERVRLTLPDASAQELSHRFSMQRRDEAFTAVADASLAGADFGEALASTPTDEPLDPALAALDRDGARAHFLAYFAELGREGVYPAARFLAQWLRAHPEDTAALLDDLRSGAIAREAHASLFLALELAGTAESRTVLIEAIDVEALGEVNRARAASALASHGAPSREVADVLLAQARESESEMVANVSRLGLGSLAGRADGPLGNELRELLGSELEAAASREDVVVAIDAIGNCADDRFAGALTAHLDAAEPSVRAHAAGALGRISPEVARPQLVEHLDSEEDPQVAAALLRSLAHADRGAALSEEELALAARRLESPYAQVRSGVIEWLGRASSQPEVRRLLAAHFHRETDLRLQQQVGSHVSAAEIRAAG